MKTSKPKLIKVYLQSLDRNLLVTAFLGLAVCAGFIWYSLKYPFDGSENTFEGEVVKAVVMQGYGIMGQEVTVKLANGLEVSASNSEQPVLAGDKVIVVERTRKNGGKSNYTIK